MRIVRVTLTAIEDGDTLVLLDGRGRWVRRLSPEKATRCTKRHANRAIWKIWARQSLKLLRANLNNHARKQDLWGRRIQNWIISIRLRKRDRLRPRKPRHEPRQTREWIDALKRMWFEHNNAARRTGKWSSWAYNTAKNSGRRYEAIQCQQRANRPQSAAYAT